MKIILNYQSVFTFFLWYLFISNPVEASTNDLFSKGKLLYESTMTTPESMQDWRMEGQGAVDFRNGWMHMFSPDEASHHVYWCPVSFPGSIIAEWEVQNIETDSGLLIVFFSAIGERGEDIFDPILPKRNGDFRQYTRGKILNYHISYYANAENKPNRGYSNLRKNNKFILVQSGEEGISTNSKKAHKIRLIKDGAHILMFIDGRKIIDWVDDGETYGPVYMDGKIGFRQMKWTHFRYRNFKVWSLGSGQ